MPSPETDVSTAQSAKVNGHAHRPETPTPPSTSASASASTSTSSTSASARPSLDELPSPLPAQKPDTPLLGAHDPPVRVRLLEDALKKEREEKQALAAQYNGLVEKLQHMRTSLGTKLKLDAEELDKREQAISVLTARGEEQAQELETLRIELSAVSDQGATLSSELALLRSRTGQLDALEVELQALRSEREKDRLDREEENRGWERERVGWEGEREGWEERERAWERERREADVLRERWEEERARATNLEGVLEDFMAAKESELKVATAELGARLQTAEKSLAEYKARAQTAESALAKSALSSVRCGELEKEVKEKNLLIGKLRHEAVIINEHLTEALRRLRKSSSENNVDRRLITNTLLAFLSTPRADSKRFEMLSLLASVLGWNDDERSKAGLQRQPGTGSSSATRRVPSTARSASSAGTPPAQGDETESFSKMWVEFLLKESSQPLSPTSAFTTSSSIPGGLSLPSTAHPSPSPTPTASTFSGLLSPNTGLVSLPKEDLFAPAQGNGNGSAPGALVSQLPVRSPPQGTIGLPGIASWSSSNGGTPAGRRV
ncbi:hypothetical protein DACRYDRAFT_51397 [Dacryopinax primogenitus]|uniref:GRIP domain-containing protein n=1 Tax=Dacryopinax primogenitus (strain DJM 731) TaxID=1858805 RepID=M5G262_DACPD|nr:uncharacterized protein DACRYDRAFT_51397 [Dacryopinax primogenitus]EJU02305.1 hypothetical protein DACRYDRAFT_51397 [Dacryopinax primogenitus]